MAPVENNDYKTVAFDEAAPGMALPKPIDRNTITYGVIDPSALRPLLARQDGGYIRNPLYKSDPENLPRNVDGGNAPKDDAINVSSKRSIPSPDYDVAQRIMERLKEPLNDQIGAVGKNIRGDGSIDRTKLTGRALDKTNQELMTTEAYADTFGVSKSQAAKDLGKPSGFIAKETKVRGGAGYCQDHL